MCFRSCPILFGRSFQHRLLSVFVLQGDTINRVTSQNTITNDAYSPPLSAPPPTVCCSVTNMFAPNGLIKHSHLSSFLCVSLTSDSPPFPSNSSQSHPSTLLSPPSINPLLPLPSNPSTQAIPHHISSKLTKMHSRYSY